MIITIIVVGLFLLSTILAVAIRLRGDEDYHFGIYIAYVLLSVILGIVSTVVVVDVSVGYGAYYQQTYEKDLISYNNIKSELASSDEAKTMVYTLQGDIDDINGKIYDSRNWSDNVWVGWFFNPYYKNLNYIVVADYVK